jgi:four helix bundle protein
MTAKELEDRLIVFSANMIELIDSLPDTRAANHLGGQLLRSSSSPALNYGEARGSESAKDFIHKNKIIVKELRESLNCLKIIERAIKTLKMDKLIELLKENDELVSIFVKTVKTSEKNLKTPKHTHSSTDTQE